MQNNQNLKKYIPLTEATYYILVSLISPLHGYGIMQNVKELSKGEFLLGPGTLYGVLNKLEKIGFIQKVDNDINDRRKVYAITERGKEILKLEFTRLKNLVTVTESLVRELGGDVNDKEI